LLSRNLETEKLLALETWGFLPSTQKESSSNY
jgi:hypothetical protein